MAYEIDYNDKRFTQVETEKKQALTENEKLYDNMVSQSDKYYQQQINAAKDWEKTQSQLQQDKTDFAIEKIEQEKDKAQKDYLKEQSGAYVDWQKQSNAYGVNAEQTAVMGMANTGYSESSQVSMYNTYQNRIATARESYNQAILNYNNAIKDAQLQNNSILAEIAYNSLQQQLELGLQQFQYKNQLLIEQANKKTELSQIYHERYQDVLKQINTENALQEELRQFNANYSLEQQKLKEEIRQFNQSYSLEQKKLKEQIRQFDEEIARLKKKDAEEFAIEIQKLEQQKAIASAELTENQRQYNQSLALQQEELAFRKSQAYASSSSSKSSGSSSGGAKSSKASSSSVKSTKTATQSDADKYGTFSNGYQPKGVIGHGELSKTGQTVSMNGQTQNVWKAEDGTKWVWDGKSKEYEQATSVAKKPNAKKAGAVAKGGMSMYIK